MSTLNLHKYYMDVCLEFDDKEESAEIERCEYVLKYAITLALRQLHGDAGCATPVDIIKYDAAERRGFLRFPARDLTRLWSALTLFSRYNGLDCAFRVYKATPILANLSIDTYVHKEKFDQLQPKRKKMKCDT